MTAQAGLIAQENTVDTDAVAPALVAVDWGTSSFRAAIVRADGTILRSMSAGKGIAKIPGRDFSQAFRQLLSSWEAELASLPIYLCGMVGSRQGWVETTYQECPAGFEDIARGTTRCKIDGMELRFIPGLHRYDNVAGHDVMRGEETQVIGGMTLGRERIVVTPGTHSKWILTEGQSVRHFRTFMTGDIFAAMRGHTILAHSMDEGSTLASPGEVSFEQGVRQGFRTNALMGELFSVRTRSLFSEPGFHAASYLSGLLIGSEFASGVALYPAATREGVTVIGSAALMPFYVRAAQCLGIDTEVVDGEASVLGCYRLARLNGEAW
ncbi:2-dehydro-3-deoxygalactonokinase [Ralstonia flaminis]|jgi:2-dehydro-3-deoxygalactonokinase|uniref:2-dehydro-3-deoxygalactonokinase DgoK1 n=1 Tax=Ralstonia flaminis TaxID=3058597 RepID=A0ABM9K766_9RALS|nr:2-dehydro-3-deoxygalactonokinase [Ralstonia sp. LMG 18101]CAJ0817931.1 putative 2-dehydro-3-deoxygalactonokinase DgoK1 [Ralstonia sp. LMG 18101]